MTCKKVEVLVGEVEILDLDLLGNSGGNTSFRANYCDKIMEMCYVQLSYIVEVDISMHVMHALLHPV